MASGCVQIDIPFELHGIVYIAGEQAEMFGWALTAVQHSIMSLNNYFKQKASLVIQEVLSLSTFIHVILRMVDMF